MASIGEGNPVKDLLWVVGFIVVLGIVWFLLGGPIQTGRLGLSATSSATSTIPDIVPDNTAGEDRRGLLKRPGTPLAEEPAGEAGSEVDSPYAGQIYLRLGASGETTNDLDEEYVELRASPANDTPINITGWKIDNGKGEKTFTLNSRLVRGVSTVVKIPKGTRLLTGEGNSVQASIYLEPGERAYVISGGVPIQTAYKVESSFKMNKCFGYIARYPHYRFTPNSYTRCPAYDEELDPQAIPDSCLSAVRRYGSSCLTPKITYDREGQKLLNGYTLPSACQKLITANFNYSLCLARHKNDPDFSGDRWFVYLYRKGFPLYASHNATITLYDSMGRVVDRYTY